MKSDHSKIMGATFLWISLLVMVGCKNPLADVSGSVIPQDHRPGSDNSQLAALPTCEEDAIATKACQVVAGTYVTKKTGADITAISGATTVLIPLGFYSGLTAVRVQDTQLVPLNIRQGISVFGITGNLEEKLSNCTNDSLNSSACSTGANSYVTTTAGGNINSWSNSGASTTVGASIMTGFYSGKSVGFTDSSLIASNIRSGVSVFGVAGSYTTSSSMVLVNTTVTTNGTGSSICTAAACPATYSSLGCAGGGGGGAANSTSLRQLAESNALTDAVSNNFSSSCSYTFTSVSTFNKSTCLRACVH